MILAIFGVVRFWLSIRDFFSIPVQSGEEEAGTGDHDEQTLRALGSERPNVESQGCLDEKSNISFLMKGLIYLVLPTLFMEYRVL
jgi:hypothetical protein